MGEYLWRWLALGRPAWLYLLHAALVTGSLAITSLLFNITVLALGQPRGLLGTLAIVGVATAGLFTLPLWWLAGRGGLRAALLASAALQACSTFTVALMPGRTALIAAAALTGVAALLFQISAAPFMMRHSDAATRDHLFSANAAINLGVAGVASLLAGRLPALCAGLLGVGPESAEAYRATFAVAGSGLLLALVPLLIIRSRDGLAVASRVQEPEERSDRAVAQMGPAEPCSLLQRVPEPWRSLIAHPWPVIQLLIPPALISCGAALLVPYLNLFFKERFALPDQALGAIFATIGLATGAAALLGPLISGRIGKVPTIVITQALSIPFLLAAGFVPVLGLAVGAAALRGALFNIGSPLYDALAMERSAPPTRPMVIGLINGAYAGGYLVLPVVSVAVQERLGFAPLFVATAACYTLAALATFWFWGRPARR